MRVQALTAPIGLAGIMPWEQAQGSGGMQRTGGHCSGAGPEYARVRTPEKDRIALRHLVAMWAGLEWHELDIPYTDPANSEHRMDAAPDRYRYVLEQKVVAPPGRSGNYSSGSTELLGAVLK